MSTTARRKRLSAAETAFLISEIRSRPAHMGTLALFEAGPDGPLTYEAVRQLVSERMALVPAFRRRIVEVPFGLDRPYVFDDTATELDYHIRSIAVPPPGHRQELADFVARLHEQPLDRSRPLWELYVIEGLRDGLVGLFAKVHFVLMDPQNGTEVMTALLDSEQDAPVPPPAPPAAPYEVPTPLAMVARAGLSYVRQPARIFRAQREMTGRTLRNVGDQLPVARDIMVETMRRTQGVGDLLRGRGRDRERDDVDVGRRSLRAPRVSFNRRLTPHRRVGFASLPFADVHAIKTAAGTTVHDVVMAVCAGGLRNWLHEHDELPTEPLVANVPVLVRGKGGVGDHIAALQAPLPTNEADPRRRLQKAHEAMQLAKERHAVPASLLQDMSRYAPPAVAGLAARLVAANPVEDVTSPPYNVTISNVPGPRHPVYCAGRRQVSNHPLNVLTNGVGLHISLVTYDDQLHLGLVSCREALPDLWPLVDAIVAASTELREAVVGDDAG